MDGVDGMDGMDGTIFERQAAALLYAVATGLEAKNWIADRQSRASPASDVLVSRHR